MVAPALVELPMVAQEVLREEPAMAQAMQGKFAVAVVELVDVV